MDSTGNIQVSLVTSKTKVAPIKRLTIPHLELCGAYLLAQLLHHVRKVLDLSISNVYAWTDSTIVLSWLVGNPRRFKTYVRNRVSYIIDLIPLDSGITSKDLTIWLTAPLVVYFLLSFSSTSCGGMVLHGSDFPSPSGQGH